MKTYTVSHIPMCDAVPEALIDTYRWENTGYSPRASARLSLVGDTLFLRMRVEESDPLIRYQPGDPNPRVWCDSCMEFFFSANDKPAYVNLEMNAGGCYLCNVGEGRRGRVVCDVFAENGQPSATVGDGFWQVEAALSLRKIAKVFGVEAVTSLRGNFYKCGDETALPHYGMWSEIALTEADYHRPEFFGSILLPAQA